MSQALTEQVSSSVMVWLVSVLIDERWAPAPCQSVYSVWLLLLLNALPKAITLAWWATVLRFLQMGQRQSGFEKVYQRDGVEPLVTKIVEVEQFLVLRCEELRKLDLSVVTHLLSPTFRVWPLPFPVVGCFPESIGSAQRLREGMQVFISPTHGPLDHPMQLAQSDVGIDQ
jgi:hypothetical protein